MATRLYKFVVDGSDVTMYKSKDGAFVLDELDSNQSLTYDPVTGDVTLRETNDTTIEIKVFHQTADQTDDPRCISGANRAKPRSTAPRSSITMPIMTATSTTPSAAPTAAITIMAGPATTT